MRAKRPATAPNDAAVIPLFREPLLDIKLHCVTCAMDKGIQNGAQKETIQRGIFSGTQKNVLKAGRESWQISYKEK